MSSLRLRLKILYLKFLVWRIGQDNQFDAVINLLASRQLSTEHIPNLLERIETTMHIELPGRQRDARINLLVAICSTMVIIGTLFTAYNTPKNMLIIPIWSVCAIGLLTYREHRLDRMAV